MPVRPYLEITRFTLCAIVFAMALEGYWLAIRRFEPFQPEALLAALTVACAIGFANAFNDIVDEPVDRVNAPRRPIPSGRIGLAQAKWLVALLCLLSVALGALAGPRMLLLTLGALAGSALYNLWARRVPLLGNALVALLCALTLSAGYCVARDGVFPIVPFASSFTFILARELLGTAGDVAGDRVGGRVTLAMLLGARPVLGLCLGLALLALLLLASAVWYVAYPAFYLACLLLTSLLPIGLAARALWRDHSPERIRAVSYRMRVVFAANIVTFLFLVPRG